MKIAILILLVSTFVSAAKPPQSPNFFEVNTDVTDIRPDKQVAIEHYKNRVQKKEVERQVTKQPQTSAAERAVQSSPGMNSL